MPRSSTPATAVLAALITCACASTAQAESTPTEDTAPAAVVPLEALYFRDEIFIRTQSGELARVGLISAPPNTTTTRHPGEVLWWNTDADVWDLVPSADRQRLLAVMSRNDELFVDAIAGEPLAAPYPLSISEALGVVSPTGSTVTVVGPHAIEHFDRESHRRVRLHPTLDVRGFPTIGHASDGTIYVGFNAGEWGGGLSRIDPETGTVELLGDLSPDSGCTKPLDVECDPVVSIIPDPEHEACVLAAVGLVHFVATGRLLRVCGADVELAWTSDAQSEAAVFGVAALGSTVVLSTSEGIVQLGPDPLVLSADPIALEHHGELWISPDLGGVLFVGTEANRTFSVSGMTPLLVPTRRPAVEPVPIELQPM